MRNDPLQSHTSDYGAKRVDLINALILAYFLIHPPITACAEAPEPPMPESISNELNPSGDTFGFDASASIYSDLRWRGISLTAERPGASTATQFSYNHGRFISVIDINSYSYTADPPSTNSTGSFTDLAYLMTESRIGTKVIVGDARTSDTYLMFSRGIYSWPGGSTWQYVSETCTAGGTAQSYITKSYKISSVKTSDVIFNWSGLKLSYSMSDLKTVDTTAALNRQLWEDYFSVQSEPRQISNLYSFDITYGHWNNTGHHYDLNLHYHFSKDIIGTMKCYSFKSYTPTFNDQYGITFSGRYDLTK